MRLRQLYRLLQETTTCRSTSANKVSFNRESVTTATFHIIYVSLWFEMDSINPQLSHILQGLQWQIQKTAGLHLAVHNNALITAVDHSQLKVDLLQSELPLCLSFGSGLLSDHRSKQETQPSHPASGCDNILYSSPFEST